VEGSREHFGSAGRHSMINYVALTIVNVLDWDMDIQRAIAAPHVGCRNGPTELERAWACHEHTGRAGLMTLAWTKNQKRSRAAMDGTRGDEAATEKP
jgi:gamma-glutamyltranspeptidase